MQPTHRGLSILVACSIGAAGLGTAVSSPRRSAAQAPVEAAQVLGVIGGSVQAVTVDGARAYIGVGSRVRVLDLGAAGRPAALGESEQLPGLVEGLAVTGGRVYAAARSAGLRVLDAAGAAAPRQLGGGPKARLARAVQVQGGFAYVADGGNGVRVLDLADPAAPTEVAVLELSGGEAWDLTLRDGKAFVADRLGLKVFDVANPRVPQLIGGRETPGWARDVVLGSGHAFVADGERGLIVMDLADLTDIGRVADLDTSGDAWSLALEGSRLYIADGDGLRIVDVADPEAPRLVGSLALPGEVQELALYGSTVLLAAGSAGLLLVDASQPGAPTLAAALPEAPLMANAAGVAGDRLLVADGSLGLLDFALVESGLPAGHTRLELPGTASEIELDPGRAWVAAKAGGLAVVDLGLPGQPRLLGRLERSGRRINDIALSPDGPAILDAPTAGGKHGLHLLDSALPAQPQVKGSSLTLSLAYDVRLSGARAYIADLDGLRVFDLTDRATPEELGQADPIGVVYGLALAGDRAYASVGESGLRVLDVSDPTRRRVVGSMDTAGYFRDLVLLGDLVFVADKDFGLRVLKLEAGDRLREWAAVPLTGTVEHVALGDGLAYVSLGAAGLAVVRWQAPRGQPSATPAVTAIPTKGTGGQAGRLILPWLGKGG